MRLIATTRVPSSSAGLSDQTNLVEAGVSRSPRLRLPPAATAHAVVWTDTRIRPRHGEDSGLGGQPSRAGRADNRRRDRDLRRDRPAPGGRRGAGVRDRPARRTTRRGPQLIAGGMSGCSVRGCRSRRRRAAHDRRSGVVRWPTGRRRQQCRRESRWLDRAHGCSRVCAMDVNISGTMPVKCARRSLICALLVAVR